MGADHAETLSIHEQLLRDPAALSAAFDSAAQSFLEVGVAEGHFGDASASDLRWPVPDAGEAIDAAGLRRRVELVHALWAGIPARREARLADAYTRFAPLMPAYHVGNRIYVQVREQFVSRGAGTAEDLLGLYQTLYLEALARGDAFLPDEGEAALQRARITRGPLEHARAVAEALSSVTVGDDPRWEDDYACEVDGERVEGTLRDVLKNVAQRTLDTIAAGGLVSSRYNTYTNFAWFGCAVWKVLAEIELALAEAPAPPRELADDLARGKAMMIEFMQAHQEDPARLKPEQYWYGQPYSYLTRDMIDLATRLADGWNKTSPSDPIVLPDLLTGNPDGTFVEYRHVGRKGTHSGLSRAWRLARWVKASWRFGKQKERLASETLADPEKRRRAWANAVAWGDATVDVFGIDVRVRMDPGFEAVARDLELASGKRRVLFLPTHQTLFDHPVMFHTLGRPEMRAAMGWDGPQPCAIVALTGLARRGVRIGSWQLTMFGMSSERFDELQDKVDGYVMLARGGSAAHTTQALVRALDDRPGIIYPMGTTSAFAIQNFPMQHGIFAYVPQDVVIVPMALRGIHQLWPKCPAGNVNINPGIVEVYVAPPMLGETTLLPRRRSLRVQAEAAALFQAVHITTLFDPGAGSAAG